MTRSTFGGTAADTVARRVKVLGHDVDDYDAATLTVWSAATGGTQYTDMLVGGAASSSVPVDATGQIPEFQGPDGVAVVYVSAGGARVKMLPSEGPTDSAMAAAVADGASSTRANLNAAFAGEIADDASDTRAALVALKPRAYDDYTGLTDAALTTAHKMRSGHPITMFNLGGTDYATSGGALVHTTTTTTTAAYLGTQLPTEVRSIGFEAKWTDASQANDELVALIISASEFTVAGFADAGMHLLIYRDHWTFQWFESGVGPTTLDSGTFDPLVFGQWRRFGVTWDGYQPTIHFPDGSSHTVAHDDVMNTHWGTHATWESYSVGNVNPVAIRSLYADATVETPTPQNTPGTAKLPKSVGTASLSLTGGLTIVDTVSIVVPPSRRVLVLAKEYVIQAAGDLYSQVDCGGNATSLVFQLELSEACNRYVPISAVLNLSEFTPGTTQTVNVRLWSFAATGTRETSSAGHKLQLVTVLPIETATF